MLFRTSTDTNNLATRSTNYKNLAGEDRQRESERVTTALEVSEFFELLKSNGAEIDFAMKWFIKKALRK